MFTHLLVESNKLFAVEFSDYAEKHFLKEFRKKYKGAQWKLTEDAIRDDLMRLGYGGYDLQKTQQVDELWHAGNIWVFKYDFSCGEDEMFSENFGEPIDRRD